MQGNNNANIVAEDYMALDSKDFANETIIGLYYFDNASGYDAIVVSYNELNPSFNVLITLIDDNNEERVDIGKSCLTFSGVKAYIESKLYGVNGLVFSDDYSVGVWLESIWCIVI
jgi:hypothetical protein